MSAIPQPDPRPLTARLARGPRGVHHANPPLPDLRVEGEHGLMRAASDIIEVMAPEAPALIDVTERLESFVVASGVTQGQLLVHSLHTTVAVIVNEREPLLHEDVASFLERMAPLGAGYRHDDFEVRTVNMNPGEHANAHAHLRQLMLGGSVHLPVIKGRLALGKWQRAFVVELDSPRPRRIALQLTGIRGY